MCVTADERKFMPLFYIMIGLCYDIFLNSQEILVKIAIILNLLIDFLFFFIAGKILSFFGVHLN